jgi:drug/metabolite transporter (DMT)-like permease
MWGTADFFAGRLSKKHHPFAVLGFSQVIGLFVGILVLLISGNWEGKVFGFDGFLIPGVLAGLFGYIGLACLYEGLSTGRMGVVSPVSSLSTVIPLAYALITGDVLSTITLVGVVIAVVGVFCASGPELSQGLPLKPILLALGAAAGFIMNPNHEDDVVNSVFYLGAWYRYGDAIAPYVGFEWAKAKLGISYDVNLSGFTSATKGNGALELSLIYNGFIIRNETRTYNFSCPRF